MGHTRFDALVGARDDAPHAPGEHRFWHETWWFWFFNPQRRFGGWLYNYIRPNIGISGGGCFVWDDGTHNHMEVPYYTSYSAQPMPAVDGPRIAFASGTLVETLAPMSRYRLAHRDRDLIDVALEWNAVNPPWVSAHGEPPAAYHLDQFGRVTGQVRLHGESIPIDCIAMRDRTWSPRQERWKDGGGYGYTNGAASAELNFMHGAFLVIDGVRANLASTRTIERDRTHGYITAIKVQGRDDAGRTIEAVGTPVSRMAMPIPGVHAVVWTSLIRWELNGVEAWGEDQEPWPLNRWSELRRLQKAGQWVDRPTQLP
ncbi:MAG: hypothetical protein AB7Q97_21100 [Gammaproteobacteria bacterium]